MYEWVSLTFIPVHGEYRHLEEHIRFSKKMGIKNQILVENGDLVNLDKGKSREIVGRINSGRTVLKGNKIISLNDKYLSDLNIINTEGEIFINIISDLNDKLLSDPVIFCPSVPIEENTISELRLKITEVINLCKKSLDDSLLQIKSRFL